MRLPVWARRITSLPLRRVGLRSRHGPNKGRRWSLPVSGRGVLVGRYEPVRFSTLAEVIRSDDSVWDLGAHYGYASLIAAARLDDPRRLVCVEPSSLNRRYLTRHLEWNGATGAHILDCAIAEADGSETFGGRGGSVSFHLGHIGERVTVRSIDSLVVGNLPRPTFLKVDVEGAEVRVLDGARDVLSGRGGHPPPLVLISVHGAARLEGCLDVLRAFDYEVLASSAVVDYLDGRSRWSGDPDLLAIPAHRLVEKPLLARAPAFRGGRTL